jgi:hypothetical protein
LPVVATPARCLIALLLCGALIAGCGGGTERAQAPTTTRPASEAARVLWGAWIDRHRTGTLPPWDMAAVDELERSVGKRMSLIAFGTPFADHAGSTYYSFPTAQMNAVVARGATPLFSWGSHAQGNYDDPDFTLHAIASGRQDRYIKAWAAAAHAWQHPFLLRFNWEMNGDWFPWDERYGRQGTGDYVAAWHHVHAIFGKAGATNARWVWCPAADPLGILQPLASLYPGAAEVDWTCLDGYNRDQPWQTAQQILQPTYDLITKEIAPHKPMLLGEVASTESGGDKARWIDELFASLTSTFPRVRAFTWFDKVEPGSSGHTDWALDSSAATTKAFAKSIASPRYAGGKPG